MLVEFCEDDMLIYNYDIVGLVCEIGDFLGKDC